MVDKLMRYTLKDVGLDEGDPTHIIQRLRAQVADMTDDAIVEACVNAARDAGINSLYLLDKTFVVDAIREKIQGTRQDIPRWISVEERLPGGEVLAVNDRGTMHIGCVEYYTYGGVRVCMCVDCDSSISISNVTHWMSLPEPPKEE